MSSGCACTASVCTWFFLAALRGSTACAGDEVDGVVLLQRSAELHERHATVQPVTLPDLPADFKDGDYAAGLNGTNSCPPGYQSIDTERACRQAKNALDLGVWRRKDSFPLKPFGCFTDPSGDLYLNSNTSGIAKEGHAPICQKATDGDGVQEVDPSSAVADTMGIGADVNDVYVAPTTSEVSAITAETSAPDDMSLEDMEAEIVRSHNSAAALTGQLGVLGNAIAYTSQLESGAGVGFSGQPIASNDAVNFQAQLGYSGSLGASTGDLAQVGVTSDGSGSSTQLFVNRDTLGQTSPLIASNDAVNSQEQFGVSLEPNTATVTGGDEDTIQDRERDIIAAAGVKSSSPVDDDLEDGFEVPMLPGAMEDSELAIIAEKELPHASMAIIAAKELPHASLTGGPEAAKLVVASQPRVTNSGASWQP